MLKETRVCVSENWSFQRFTASLLKLNNSARSGCFLQMFLSCIRRQQPVLTRSLHQPFRGAGARLSQLLATPESGHLKGETKIPGIPLGAAPSAHDNGDKAARRRRRRRAQRASIPSTEPPAPSPDLPDCGGVFVPMRHKRVKELRP